MRKGDYLDIPPVANRPFLPWLLAFLALVLVACNSDDGDEGQAHYAIAGTAEGLDDTAVLLLNDQESLSVTNGAFQFEQRLPVGEHYQVEITDAPAGQDCDLDNGVGQLGDSDVEDLYLLCENLQYIPGESYFGEHGYIEYIAGDLPILFVAPHGGKLEPEHLPIVSSHGGDGGSLSNTLLTAEFIKEMTAGGQPHVIINHLRSNRLNAARGKDDAAGDHPEARHAWEEFHAFIEDAKSEVVGNWGKGHYFEFHTNGWPEGWINIGLGVSKKYLNDGGEALLARAPFSTVRYLVEGEGADFLEILLGPTSLGGLLAERGYHVVPSPEVPAPGDGGFFFAGWNTWKHGSRHGGTIDATHLETHWQYINAGAEKRQAYSEDLADAILVFMQTHYFGYQWRQP